MGGVITMARLGGTNLPSNLISVGNAIQIVGHAPCRKNNSSEFYVLIMAENTSGKVIQIDFR